MHTHYITAVMFTRCTNLYFVVILVYNTKGKNGEIMSGKKTRDNPRKSLNRPVTNLGKSASVFRTILLLKCSEKAVILFENTQKSRKTNPFLLKSTFFYFWKLPLFSDSKTYKKLKLIPT